MSDRLSELAFMDEVFFRCIAVSVQMSIAPGPGVTGPNGQPTNLNINIQQACQIAWSVAMHATLNRDNVDENYGKNKVAMETEKAKQVKPKGIVLGN